VRVLLVAAPLVGHVLPLVPLARALEAAGHEVRLASAGDGAAAGRDHGLPTTDVALGLTVGPVFVRALARHPRLVAREARGGTGTDVVGLLFAAVGERMAAGTVALADDWAPDLVVQEPLAVAGSLAAARRGVPVVLLEGNLFDAGDLLAATSARFDTRRLRRHGVGELPPPAAVLLTAPPSLVGRRRGLPLRFVPVGDGAAPDDLARRGDRPRIIVSRSTVKDPRPDRLMRQVVAATTGLDVDVVLARPDRAVARRPLPANVRTTGWLPFPSVFPVSAGVVHHGGAGTVMTALAAGTPQLVVPGAGDRRVNAELVAARGAGLAVPGDRITGEALLRLAHDERLREAAAEVAAEIAAMPPPSALVPRLEDVAAGAPRPAPFEGPV
jgi:UDP:flavonoid glycosyltransferase YjiC (YdhE family)